MYKGAIIKYKTDIETKYGVVKEVLVDGFMVIFTINYIKPQINSVDDIRFDETNTIKISVSDNRYITIITEEEMLKGIDNNLEEFLQVLECKKSILDEAIVNVKNRLLNV